MLHHSIIEGCSRQLREFLAPVFFKSSGSGHHGNESPEFRSVPVKFSQNRRHGPDKHTGIPAKVSFANKGFGQVDIWFLTEAQNSVQTRTAQNRFANFNVAKTRMGRCWSDADGNKR